RVNERGRIVLRDGPLASSADAWRLDPVDPSGARRMGGGPLLQPGYSRRTEIFSVAVGARLLESLVHGPPVHGVTGQGRHHAGAISPGRTVNVDRLVLRVLDECQKLLGLTRRGQGSFAQRNPQDIRESVRR